MKIKYKKRFNDEFNIDLFSFEDIDTIGINRGGMSNYYTGGYPNMCCCGRPCLIWEYDPTTEDIGQPIDPPWYVVSGTWSVVDGTAWGRDAVLEVTGPAKIWHRIHHPLNHYTGHLKVNIIVPTTVAARYRLLINSTGLAGVSYYITEWIPFPSGADPENQRFLTGPGAVELSNLKDDAPLYYWAGGTPGVDKNLEIYWRCKGDDNTIQLEDITTVEGLQACLPPISGGSYVGIEIPDATTVRIPKAEFWQVKDSYSGDDAICLGCSCARCSVDGETCFNMYKPVTVTYESSCVGLDGQSYILEPNPTPESFSGGTCGGFSNDNDPLALPGCNSDTAWSLPVVFLAVTHVTDGNFPLWDHRCHPHADELNPVYPNANSTCDPFYLEYGPFAMGVSNPEDPPENWVCCCPGCPLDECDWLKIIITQ